MNEVNGTLSGAAQQIEDLIGDEEPEVIDDPQGQGEYNRDARLSQQEELGLEDEGQVEAQEEEDEEVTPEDETAESAQESEEEAPEEVEYAETIEEIAESMEITPDELLGRLKYKKGDHEIALKEFVDQYSENIDIKEQRASIQAEREEHAAHRKQGEELFQTSLNVHLGQLEALNKYFEDQKNSDAMRNLRLEDPGEHAAQQQEIDSFLRILGAEKEKAITNFQEYKTQSQQQFLQEQGQILKRDVPDWGQEKMSEAVEALKGFGFHDEEIPGIADARAIKAVLELNSLRAEVKSLRESEAARKAAVKKVQRKVNPVLKANTKNRSETVKQERARDEITGRFKKSGKLQDAAELVDAMMGDTFE